jgi:hypothetical protein
MQGSAIGKDEQALMFHVAGHGSAAYLFEAVPQFLEKL